MKKRVIRITAVVLALLAAAGIIARISSAPLALALGGYDGDTVIIEEGFTHVPATSHWRVLLSEKNGEARLAFMEQGFLGFWKLPVSADEMSGDYEGLEYIGVSTQPPCGPFYAYAPYAIADTITRTDHWKFSMEHITRADYFYHGNNAVHTIMLSEDSLPRDSTLQIYQNGPEYVLHLCQYCKGSGLFDGDFSKLYQSLLDNGCIE